MTNKMIRARVDRLLKTEGRPATDDQEWQLVFEQCGELEEYSPDEIVNFVTSVRKVYKRVDPVRPGRGVPAARKYALSLLLAELARARPDVQAFRREHCPERLMKIPDVEPWVRKTADAEGPATSWAQEVALPRAPTASPESGWQFTAFVKKIQFDGAETKMVRYPRPDMGVSAAGVRAGGTLHALYRLAQSLAADFTWTEAEAVMFVLTDQPPPVEPAKCFARPSLISPCLSRITLVIDPALSPSQVQELYERTRAEVIEGRYRNLSRKHALLAGFTATIPGEKLRDQMRKWNAQYPLWRYKLVTNFGRDAKKARDRLLSPANLKPTLGGKHVQKKTRK